MNYTTPVNIVPTPILSPDSRILMLGSCFADEMTERMQRHGLHVVSNPFGTLYNPLSIAACLRRLIDATPFCEADLVERDGLYHSWLHHGSFSHATAEETLAAINAALQAGHQALLDADTIILTLGTAYVYERQGEVVSNCHKFPASEFTRRRISIEEIVDTYSVFSEPCLKDKRIILTLSPIRHKADGLTENSLSKATLRVAIDELSSTISPQGEQFHNSTVQQPLYFPSYEIFMDELRDYRWYAADMIHPAPQAVDYVWERFCDTYFTAAGREILRRNLAAWKAANHRPLH